MTEEELGKQIDNHIKKHRLEDDRQIRIAIGFLLLDIDELKEQLEILLKYAKDKGIIKSWFYNGSYSWEFADNEQVEELSKRITELQADKDRLIDENSLTRVLVDRCKELGIKDLYHLKDLLELAEENKRLKKQLELFNLSGNTVAKTSYNESVNKNVVLKAQIEKMKCCGNCKNRGLEKYIAYPCCECKIWHRELKEDKWELID